MTAPDPRLDEIEARLNAATPGPWDHYGNLGHEVFQRTEIEDSEPGIAFDIPKLQDATFIANAPADVAYLLAELRKAQAKLARVEAECAATDTETDEALQGDLVARIRAAAAERGGE